METNNVMTLNRLHRAIICLLVICFVCVFIGTTDILSSQTIGTTHNSNISLLLGFSLCFLCLAFVWKCFRFLDTLSKKSCYIISIILLLLITGIMLLFSFSARVGQLHDSIDVLDTAFYLRTHVEATKQLPYARFIGSFGNNYPIILFISFLVKLLMALGVQDVEETLNHLNVIVLMAAVILAWLTVKETKGIIAATKTVLICLFNPYLYLLVNWTYSMTYSLPFMMGILYVAIRIKNAKSGFGAIALALIEGLLIGAGFSIRPTTVFPLIAAVIVWFPQLVKRIDKRKIAQFLCGLLTIIFVLVFVNIQVEKRFGKIKHMNMPLSFWTLMGSHVNGGWNTSDFDDMRAIENPDERAGYGLDMTLKNYQEQGIDGTLNLWYRKLNLAWKYGGFFYSQIAVSNGNTFSEYFLESGARNQLIRIYCQAFRLFMIIGFLLTCIYSIFKRNIPEIVLIMIITIFGCVAFHTIWETNERYSIPFLLPMLMVIGYGISSAGDYVERKIKTEKHQNRLIGMILMGFLIIVCSNLNGALKEKDTLNFYRIYSAANTRICEEVEPNGFLQLDQDFYTDKPFNALFFKAAIPSQAGKENCSGYKLSIQNDKEEELYTTELLPDQISGQGIKVLFDTISGYNHYYIRLRKLEPEKESILFYTQYTYGLDPYKGDLILDKGAPYPSDLMMDVYEEIKETEVIGNKVRLIVIIAILLSGAFIAFVPVKKRQT